MQSWSGNGETRCRSAVGAKISMLKRLVRWNRELSSRLERRFPSFFDYPSYHEELMRRIRASLDRPTSAVLEAGGIDRPLLRKGGGFRYDGLDIEDRPSCHEIYDRFLVQSVETPIAGNYDLIVSMTLLEHVPDNRASLRAMLHALRPGGEMHHYVPGSNHPYALATRMVGPRLQKRLIHSLRPNVDAHTSGYPTYFDACTPAAMKLRMQEAGFEAIHFVCFYRANDYFAWFTPLFVLVTAFENLSRRLRWSVFASGFVISARRPLSALLQPAVEKVASGVETAPVDSTRPSV